MNRIFFLFLPLLFISGCVAEPGHVVYSAFAGLWGLYFATYLINRLINNAKEKKKYILTIIILILSFVAPAFVLDSDSEYIFIVVMVGVISFLLFSTIAFIVSNTLEAKADDKTKDRFPILLTIMLLIYLLIPGFFLIILILP